MIKLESKKGTVNAKQQTVYNFLTDFRNFSGLLPAEKLRNLEISNDKLKFDIDGLGTIGLVMGEKTPYSDILIKPIDKSSTDFTLRLFITRLQESSSVVQISLEANLNMFLEMMAKSPLQQFIDLMVDKLSGFDFKEQQ